MKKEKKKKYQENQVFTPQFVTLEGGIRHNWAVLQKQIPFLRLTYLSSGSRGPWICVSKPRIIKEPQFPTKLSEAAEYILGDTFSMEYMKHKQWLWVV